MKYTFVYLSILVILLSLGSAIDFIDPVKQGECVQLPQVCATCTYNNLSVVQYPNGTYALRGEYVMTKIGITYNYTWCDTNTIGTYQVDGHGDLSGADTGWGGYTFKVNGSGQEIPQSQIILLFAGLGIIILVGIFFFILSMIFKHPGVKVFFMALASITAILLIGIVASNANLYLAEFPNLANIYNSYYIFIISIGGAAMLGVIIWLIYYSFTLFNKSRGRIPED